MHYICLQSSYYSIQLFLDYPFQYSFSKHVVDAYNDIMIFLSQYFIFRQFLKLELVYFTLFIYSFNNITKATTLFQAQY